MEEEVEAAIELLRAAGTDTEEVEAKAAAGGLPGQSLLRSISAFANTGTGLVLLGLDEESGFELVDIDASALASQLAGAGTPPSVGIGAAVDDRAARAHRPRHEAERPTLAEQARA